jgi:ABC-2 type transport system permease protein
MWLVILAVGTGTRIANAYGYSLEDMSRFTRYFVLSSSVASGNSMTFLFALFSAMCAFSFMYSPRSANAMAALPVRRERMFTVQALAGLVPLIVANVLVALATYGVEAYHGVADAAPLAQWVAIVTMQLILYYGLAILCAQLTGNIIVLPILYVVLNFTVFVVELVTRRALEFFVYGVPAGSNTLTVFSPVVYLWENVTVNLPSGTDTVDYAHSTFSGWGVLAIYCVVGVIFAVCALLLFRKKRVETAGDVVAVKALKPVFKYCFTLGGSLVIGVVLYWLLRQNMYSDGSVWMLLVLMLVGGFVCYFAAEMLIKKSFHVWKKKAFIGFGVFAVIFIAATLAGEFNLFGYETYVPDESNIEYVGMNIGGEYMKLYESENISAAVRLHEDIIDSKSENENAIKTKAYRDSLAGINEVTYDYHLKNGRVIYRRYCLAAPLEVVESAEAVANSLESISYRRGFSIPATENNIYYAEVYYGYGDYSELTGEEAYELYTECLLPDINEGKLGKIYLILDDGYLDNVYIANVGIEQYERKDNGDYTYDYLYVTVTAEATRTLAWFDEHGYDLITVREYQQWEADGMPTTEHAVG